MKKSYRFGFTHNFKVLWFDLPKNAAIFVAKFDEDSWFVKNAPLGLMWVNGLLNLKTKDVKFIFEERD